MSTPPPQYDMVIYHGPCYDGFTAAWVAQQACPNAELVEASYGDTPPDVTGKRVLIVDYSYKRPLLEQLAKQAASIQVLDHHKSAAEDLSGLPYVEFDMDRSGAGMAWDHFFPDQHRPALVNRVEDRDLWRFAYDDTREYHAAMTCRRRTFGEWSSMARTPVAELVAEGRAVLQYIYRRAQDLAEQAVPLVLGGREFLAVNAPIFVTSETADFVLADKPDAVFMGWRWDGERGDYYVSLRSRGDAGPDCSKIAAQWGGGGHAGAAGFRLKSAPPALAGK